MSEQASPPPFKLRSKLMTALCLLLFIAATGAWLWTAGIHHPFPSTPSVALQLPGFLAQATARDDGLHLLCQREQFSHRPAGIQFEPVTRFGRGGYGRGVIVRGLGFTFAWLPRPFSGGDYIVPPYAAIVLPYWLLIVGFGYAFLRLSGLGRRLAGLCRFSRTSWALIALGSVAFLVLNGLPSAETPGGRSGPRTAVQWYMLTFEPGARVTHRYGYPFTWLTYRRTLGRPDEVNWRQHRMMENLMIGASVILMLGMAPEAGRRLIRPQMPPLACRRCGYDLRGNLSGHCPECGHQLSKGQSDLLTAPPSTSRSDR